MVSSNLQRRKILIKNEYVTAVVVVVSQSNTAW